MNNGWANCFVKLSFAKIVYWGGAVRWEMKYKGREIAIVVFTLSQSFWTTRVYSFGVGEGISFDEGLIENFHGGVFAYNPMSRLKDFL